MKTLYYFLAIFVLLFAINGNIQVAKTDDGGYKIIIVDEVEDNG